MKSAVTTLLTCSPTEAMNELEMVAMQATTSVAMKSASVVPVTRARARHWSPPRAIEAGGCRRRRDAPRRRRSTPAAGGW